MIIIKKLQKRMSNEIRRIIFKRNKKEDIDDYVRLEKIVKDNMQHPDWLGDFSKEDLILIARDVYMCGIKMIYQCVQVF